MYQGPNVRGAILVLLTLSLAATPEADGFGRKKKRSAQDESRDQIAAEEARIVAEVRQREQATDQAAADAIAAGKSLVIMGTINLDARFKSPTQEQLFGKDFNYDESATTIWTKADDPQRAIHVGNALDPQQRLEYRGSMRDETGGTVQTPLGPQYYPGDGHTLYQVFIVEPGTYRLNGSRAALRRTKVPDGVGQKEGAKSPHVGWITLSEKSFTEYSRETVWENAQYSTDYVEYSFCQAVRVVNGECVAHGRVKKPVDRLKKAAGYYDSAKVSQDGGLDTRATLEREFARFTVGPGKVVVVDGFFADYPNVEFDPAQCEWSGTEAVKCPIQAYSMTRLALSLEGLRRAVSAIPAAAEAYPRLTQLLASAEVAPLEVDASRASHTVRAGPTYRLAAGQAK